jgi:shikimate kinase
MAVRNIVLTGFMGTGKSSVGRLLAARLGYRWVDTDDLLETRHGPISKIFADLGEEVFRGLERDLAVELARHSGLVISTGGRMLLDPGSAAVLGFESRIFCLAATPEEIARRVDSSGEPVRPLLEGGDPRELIGGLLAERSEAYARFEQVDTDGRSVEEVADDIVARLDDDG